MKEKISDKFIYLTGAARYRDLVFLSLHDKKLEEQEIVHSIFIAYDQGGLSKTGLANWTAVGMCIVAVPQLGLISISKDGEVFVFNGDKDSTETIAPDVCVLRGLGCIAG